MKLFLGLFVFFSVRVSGQSMAYIVNIEPDSACAGTLIKVSLHINTSCVPQSAPVYVADSATLMSVVGGSIENWMDSGFVMHFVNTTNNLVTGKHTFIIANCGNCGYKPFTQLNCTTGIEHNYRVEDVISTNYFNLLGQPIKEPDGITVEVKHYRDGSTQTRKIVRDK